MKKIALALTLVSGLYLNGKARAEGVGTETTKPDSNKFNTVQVEEFEAVSSQAGIAADELMTNPTFASPSKQADEQTSRSFELNLTSAKAGRAAEEVRAIYE